jgi:hypothetical protein
MLNVERLLPNITPKIILLSAFMCICLWFVFVDYNIAGMKSFFTFMSGVFVTEWFTAFLRTKDKKENSRLPILEMIRGINYHTNASSLKIKN